MVDFGRERFADLGDAGLDLGGRFLARVLMVRPTAG